jgi:DNA gyrase inhibitor GyrI
MKVKISARTGSYAIYVHNHDDDKFVERAVNIFTKFSYAWLQEIYDPRYKKIIVMRHVAPAR